MSADQAAIQQEIARRIVEEAWECDGLRYMADAVDGQATSWRSRRLKGER